ncbi:hypothetical protein UA75_05355 [Actinoalloteichus sp. GBA129-24]|nr:hypothetical protein UA75_05355 [Actinoalloteichus sp. GBA129-24]
MIEEALGSANPAAAAGSGAELGTDLARMTASIPVDRLVAFSGGELDRTGLQRLLDAANAQRRAGRRQGLLTPVRNAGAVRKPVPPPPVRPSKAIRRADATVRRIPSDSALGGWPRWSGERRLRAARASAAETLRSVRAPPFCCWATTRTASAARRKPPPTGQKVSTPVSDHLPPSSVATAASRRPRHRDDLLGTAANPRGLTHIGRSGRRRFAHLPTRGSKSTKARIAR